MPRPRAVVCLALSLLVPVTACKRDRGSEEPVASEDGGHGSFSEREKAGPTPTPGQVCEHLARMIAAELGSVDPVAQAATVDACVVDMVHEQQLRGPEQWDLIARCVLDSSSAGDIDRCDQLYPGSQGPSGAGAREEEACIYIISMVLYELGSADAVSDAELQDMMADCVAAFDEDRRAMSADSYEAMIDCIFAAQSSAQMEQCGAN
ncbi:MAG: hypothetical protein R6X02_11965 [Enhygromyxa sp.]